MPVGSSLQAAFLNVKGKMRGFATVVNLPDAFLLVAEAGNAPSLAASLEKYVITEDVVIEDVSGKLGQVTMVGELPVEGMEAVGVECGFRHLIVPAGDMAGLMERCERAGAQRVNEDVLEAMRIEVGFARYGLDMDENTIPVEVGLEKRAINYDKGCYIGQETIARIRTYGHVNRHLVQLVVEGPAAPVRGTKIFADEREVGAVTSAAMSAGLGKAVALGYVRREFAVNGTKLKLDGPDQVGAEVIKLCG